MLNFHNVVEEFPHWNYLTLDDFDLLAQLKRDPEFILSSKQPLILDEIQRLPELFIVVKKIIDQHPDFRFILFGSANLLLMEKVSESLAGNEVDFVIEYGQSLIGIEVKSASKVSYGDITHLQQFLNEYPNAKGGIVLHSGDQVDQLAKNIFALPISILF